MTMLPSRRLTLLLAAWLFSLPAWALDWQAREGYRMAPLTFAKGKQPGFTLMPPAQTGLTFTNLLTPESDIRNQNLMNGSGLALGDVDGDGWCDIYFCNLNGANRLYRNLGNWKFAEITDTSGVGLADQLTRAATFADVDGDGDLDLILTFNGRGARLFINDGKGHFTEQTEAGFSAKRGGTSMALGDMDGDGDLDLYVANYGENTILRGGGNFAVRMVGGKPVVTGRFAHRLKIINGRMVEWGEVHDYYLNDGKGHFTPVSWTDGKFLNEDGQPLTSLLWDYGLTVQIRDLNQDSHPDIYVCNDFQTPDRVWLNDGKGNFRLIPRLAMRCISYASMSVDFADLDRDGRLDFLDIEMLSRPHELKLRQMSGVEPVFPVIGQMDNRPLLPRNTLFWNRGDGTYAEIAWYAGVAASDWSWGPIFIDVDLDGFEDLLIVNGHYHDVNDHDLAAATRTMVNNLSLQESRTRLLNYPPLATPNLAMRNRGDLTFADTSRAWGFNAMETSHGMALADLDNDGDQDVVINCLNAAALVYRNDAPAPRLAVRLKGKPGNFQGINGMIKVLGGPQQQLQEILCGSRYLCGDDPMRVFATGQATNLAIEVTWRSGRRSIVRNAQPNYYYEIDEADAEPVPASPAVPPPQPFFKDVSILIAHAHHEDPFDDFTRQPLLPKRLSQNGPGIAWTDLDGDGHEDLAIGSGKGGALAVYRSDGQGGLKLFNSKALTNVVERDQTTLLGWAYAPGKTALLVGSANYEDGLTNGEAVLRYEFQNGQVSPAAGLSAAMASVGPLALADVDGDGHLDLFVGGRVVPGRYPEPASSRLYRSAGGQFELDAENSRQFAQAGLVSGAVFSDLNGDGQPDLVLACEWGPMRVFLNQGGRFRDATAELGLADWTGWWNSVNTGDFDGDGRMDIVAGNWGLNSPYRASREQPARLYFGDFNGQGNVDLIEAYEELTPGKIVPRRDLNAMSKGLPFLQEKFPTHRSYSVATVADLLGARLNTAGELRVNTLASMVFFNRGNRFEAVPLPAQAQWAPVFALCVADLDGDGHEDLFLGQNFFATQLGMARLDAGRGLWLRGEGTGKFTPVPGQESGLLVYGEQRGAAVGDFNEDGRVDLAVSQNGAATQLYQNLRARPGLRVRLKGGDGNPAGVGAILRLLAGGKAGPARELRAGSGYWSQDSVVPVLALPAETAQLQIRWSGGRTTSAQVPPGAKEIEAGLDGAIKVTR